MLVTLTVWFSDAKAQIKLPGADQVSHIDQLWPESDNNHNEIEIWTVNFTQTDSIPRSGSSLLESLTLNQGQQKLPFSETS